MFHKNQNTTAPWQQIEPPVLLPLQENITTDCCVVGAGIAGLTSAYLLLKNGIHVVVLEKDLFGENETARSSAHLSSILDEGFSALVSTHGEENARLAYNSHSDAISLIEKIIEEESIQCDFQRVPGYLYLSPESDREYLRKEYAAARLLGCNDVKLELSPPYFAEFGPALGFEDQAQFHPLKYLRGLVSAILKMGGHIYVQSRVTEFDDNDVVVTTAEGYQVKAKNIIVATNVPINDRFAIHNKEYSYRSYVLGLEIPKDQFPSILLWDTSEPYHYVRKMAGSRPDTDLLIVGGEDHRVGLPEDGDPFDKIEAWLSKSLNLHGTRTFQWSGQIVEPSDGLAYIGKNPGDKNTYIVCGDSGHGLTHSTIAAMIFKDLLLGNENPWAELYSPQRFRLSALANFVKENARTFFQYKDWLTRPHDADAELLAGEGKVIQDGISKLALYRDEAGELHSFSASCPHMAGVVHWNSEEKTWDCPCHGSRFACTGEVLNGPALSPLQPAVRGTPDLNERSTTEKDSRLGKI